MCGADDCATAAVVWQAGYDTPEMINEAELDELTELGVKRPHAMKILKCAAECAAQDRVPPKNETSQAASMSPNRNHEVWRAQ